MEFLRSLYPENQRINSIIDGYSSHTSKVSKGKVQNFNTKLHYIPSNYTDILQPLDIAIFVPLRSKDNFNYFRNVQVLELKS